MCDGNDWNTTTATSSAEAVELNERKFNNRLFLTTVLLRHVSVAGLAHLSSEHDEQLGDRVFKTCVVLNYHVIEVLALIFKLSATSESINTDLRFIIVDCCRWNEFFITGTLYLLIVVILISTLTTCVCCVIS